MRRRVALLVSLLVALLLTGCEGHSYDPVATGLPGDASGDASFVLSTATYADFSSSVVAGGSYKLTGKLEIAGQEVDVTGVVVGTDLQITETIPGGSDPLELRKVGDQLYFNAGAATGGLFWKVDPATPEGSAISAPAGQISAAESVARVQSALVSITPSGTPEDLDGVSAQAYDVVVDTTKLGLPATAGAEVPAQLTYTYWVGADKLLRKLSFALAGITSELSFSEWGAPVTVEAPTAEQITDVPPAI